MIEWARKVSLNVLKSEVDALVGHLVVLLDHHAVGLALHVADAHLHVLLVHRQVDGGSQRRPQASSVVILMLLSLLHSVDLFCFCSRLIKTINLESWSPFIVAG